MEYSDWNYSRGAEERFSEYAYRVLRDGIMKYKLAPGAPIIEAEIADVLRVSRTPVHEALARLRDEKLVDIQPRKESRVSKIDLVLVNDGIFIRHCVESELIETIQGNVAAPIMRRMLSNINRQRQILLEGNQFNEFNDVDDEFHMLLYLAANRAYAYQQVHKIVAHFDRVRQLARMVADFTEIDARSYDEHREIFNAIAYRAPLSMDAHAIVRRHISRLQIYMDKILELHADYFESL